MSGAVVGTPVIPRALLRSKMYPALTAHRERCGAYDFRTAAPLTDLQALEKKWGRYVLVRNMACPISGLSRTIWLPSDRDRIARRQSGRYWPGYRALRGTRFFRRNLDFAHQIVMKYYASYMIIYDININKSISNAITNVTSAENIEHDHCRTDACRPVSGRR